MTRNLHPTGGASGLVAIVAEDGDGLSRVQLTFVGDARGQVFQQRSVFFHPRNADERVDIGSGSATVRTRKGLSVDESRGQTREAEDFGAFAT